MLADAPQHHSPAVLLLATGSEVALCIAAYEKLKEEGIYTRVISMPSWELFESQDQEYRNNVLPPEITARVAVEAASGFGWNRYTGLGGHILGLESFGLSAPMRAVTQHFGFEVAHVIAAVKEQLVQYATQERN